MPSASDHPHAFGRAAAGRHRGSRVRYASKGDIDRLKELEDATFSHDRLSRRSIVQATRAKSQSVLILESHHGEMLGAAFIHYRRGSRLCRLYSIAVRRETARTGLGTRLLAACASVARDRGCNEMRLEVRADRPSSIRFYELRGFQKLAHKPHFYENGSDAFQLHKVL